MYLKHITTLIRYSVVGYSEHEAIKHYGEENIGVYHSRLIPLEEGLVSRVNEVGEAMKKKAYFKVLHI